MADAAWSEVHGLLTERGDQRGTEVSTVIPMAVQESAFTHFHVHNDPADWRVRDFGIQAVIFFTNGNRLFVTEDYATLSSKVKLKK